MEEGCDRVVEFEQVWIFDSLGNTENSATFHEAGKRDNGINYAKVVTFFLFSLLYLNIIFTLVV